jgi:hypothetical protein
LSPTPASPAATPGRLARVVALGASNLTFGLPSLVAAARDACGPDVEVLAALGLGRSYGIDSTVVARTLPGIVHCGLWRALEQRPPASTRALITDVGNDIVYGCAPSQILSWVDECITRLRRFTDDIVVTDLPLDSIRRLKRLKFLLFRSITYPRSRLALGPAIAASEQVAEGLAALASQRRVRLFRPRAEWYGFDPIHIRRRDWCHAWPELLCAGERPGLARASWPEAMRLALALPERQRLFGFEQLTPQSGRRLSRGARVWLY